MKILTMAQNLDLEECEKLGDDKDCSECSCNVCVCDQTELIRLARIGAATEYVATQGVGFKKLDKATIDSWVVKYLSQEGKVE